MQKLSTLNRLLGKKSKEASRSTSNLTKSTGALDMSKSTITLDTSSQHNQISPIVNNAPFEQTFRVTVYLPKNQLYVERIGAKTKLSTLMDTICENKQIDKTKYEFRHPGDMSQAFDVDKTIGEVGLNELKLVLKTESRFNGDFHRYHADDMLKYKSSVPDSVSSSEISRNYNKNSMQKASPYSSTTSLNSLDSTGMNLTAKMQPPVAPARKKRAAPRPPSQNSIPEQEIFGTTLNVFKEPHSILPRKNFHVSSPQLNNNNNQADIKSDRNNNIETENRLNAITRPTSLYLTNTTEIHSADRRRSPSESSEVQHILRENSNSLEKKKKHHAPVPPKRVNRPVPSPRTVQDESKTPTITEIREIDEPETQPNSEEENVDNASVANVSKTMLNSIPPPEEQLPSVETSDGPISIQIISSDSSIEHVKEEPAGSPKLPTVSKVHIKLDDERRSSSEEDEMTVNIYNVTKSIVTLEKTSQVTVSASSTPVPIASSPEPEPPAKAERKLKEEPKIATETSKKVEIRSPSPSWTYTLPAPPVIADSGVVEKASPTDHQKTGDKYFSEYVTTDCNETVMSDSNTTIISTETRIQAIIVDRMPRDDTLTIAPTDYTKQVHDGESEKSTEIITSDLEDGYLGNGQVESPTPAIESNRMEKEIVIEDFKRSRLIIARSDSFHAIGQERSAENGVKRGPLSPPQRSTSFLSLNQAQKAEMRSNKSNAEIVAASRQKSTSELSISDVPSLQSLEVLRNILNSSRKNSLQDPLPKEEKIVTVNVVEETPPKPQQPISFSSVKKEEAEVVKKPERQVSDSAVETKPAETQWRYSGPPKINLSTWSERPSSKVAIAADSDYKFGGVSAVTLPRDFKNQHDSVSKRHTIHISNERAMSEKPEKHLPKVLGVEYKKDVSPPVEIVAKPSRTIINIKPRPMSMDLSNHYTALVTTPTSPSSVSYNRLNSNAKKFTPVVHGFKLNNISEGGDHVEPAPPANKLVTVTEKKIYEPPNIPAKPAFLRSTSAGDMSRKMKLASVDVHEESFSGQTGLRKNVEAKVVDDESFSGQTGLRKTGLKEKILLQDKDTKSIFGKVIEPKHETVIRYNNHVDHHVALRAFSHPAPPKPPTAPAAITFRKSAPVDIDTRDQLLDAIKNFNKDSLRRK